MKTTLTGNETAAYAVKFARVQVIAAYPINPSSPSVELISKFVEEGKLRAEFIRVESEHSAMAACIGASNCGVRTFTSTSSQGLAYMHELLHWASGSRLPIVMYVANRALAPPWSIWNDQQDSISQRDTGWIQLYVANNQELFDFILLAYRVAESNDILLPIMVCADGYSMSEMLEPVEIPDQQELDDFLPTYQPPFTLYETETPISLGALTMPNRSDSDWYTEYRFLQQEAMDKAKTKIREAAQEFKERFRRTYNGLVEEYRCKDAEVAVLSTGSIASQMRSVVDEMRENGLSIGSAQVRVFRPFPVEEITGLAQKIKAIIVLDRNISTGSTGALLSEVKASLYGSSNRPLVKGLITGLGGRDVNTDSIKALIERTLEDVDKGEIKEDTEWIGLRR